MQVVPDVEKRLPIEPASFVSEAFERSDWAMRSRGNSRLSLRICGESVANAAYRLDQARMIRVPFDLLAQSGDQIVDGTVEGRPVLALEQIHYRISRQHAMRSSHKGLQQIEFGGRKFLWLTRLLGQASAADIKHPTFKRKPLRSCWRDIVGRG